MLKHLLANMLDISNVFMSDNSEDYTSTSELLAEAAAKASAEIPIEPGNEPPVDPNRVPYTKPYLKEEEEVVY
jgi:hypothetical protein